MTLERQQRRIENRANSKIISGAGEVRSLVIIPQRILRHFEGFNPKSLAKFIISFPRLVNLRDEA